MSITFTGFSVSFAARAKLFLHQGQAETSISAPTDFTSSSRCFAEKEASWGKASFLPRPAPQQKAFSRVRGISTKLSPGMAFRMFLGWAYSPSVPRRRLRGGLTVPIHPRSPFQGVQESASLLILHESC